MANRTTITTRTPQRMTGLDALRGFAVLLMLIQHVTFWTSAASNRHWLIQFTGALGGMAAPLFITLAGVGTVLLAQRRAHVDAILAVRGLIIIGFGYLMNALTPHWFSLGSWYVLHLIGAALVSAPLLRRIPGRGMPALMAIVLLATGLLQSRLGMPFRLFNDQMAAPVQLAGALRYALVDGFFPIFPWSAFFMAGLLAGRWLTTGRSDRIWKMGITLLGIMAALSAAGRIGFDFTRMEPWVRFFKLQPSFYSAMMPLSLFLMALSLFFICGFLALEKRQAFSRTGALVNLGRSSLTFLILHVVLIRESAYSFGFWKTLPAAHALSTTIGVLVVFTLIAFAWRRIDFKYGFEWLLRRIEAEGRAA